MPLLSRRWFVLGSAAALAVARLSAPKDAALSEGSLGGEWGTTTRRIAQFWFGFAHPQSLPGELQVIVGNDVVAHQSVGDWSFLWAAVPKEEIIVPANTPIVWQLTPDVGAEARLGIIWLTKKGRSYSENIRWSGDQPPKRDDFLLPLDVRWPVIRNVG